MSTPADLQAAIAAYLAKTPGRPVPVDELAVNVKATSGMVSVILSRIVSGEARPYPIIRSGRGQYTWVHDPADHPAHLAVLTEMIGYMTGDQAHAEVAAERVLAHSLTTSVAIGQRTIGWRCRCGTYGHVRDLPPGTSFTDARRAAWRDHDKAVAS